MSEIYQPKFLYHKEQGAKLIKSSEQEQSLGEGWQDSPAKFGIETEPSQKPKEVAFDVKGQPYKKEVESEEQTEAVEEKKPKKAKKDAE